MTALLTNIVRVADGGEGFQTRHQLRAVRGGEVVVGQPPPLPRYPLAQLGRQANAVIRLVEGRGQDAGELAMALKQLRKAMELSGTYRIIRDQNGPLYAYTKPGARRRAKSRRARAAARKRAARAERRERWREGED